MQHIQARWQFKSSGRAALKSLDQPISETETFQHIVWVYAFRFLKASLSLQMPRPETASAVQQLHAIAAHAEKRGDRAIFVTCSAMEAMIHLRSSAPDHLEHVQRAIAAARSLQLQTSVKQLGQIATLIDCIDIACSIQQGRPDAQKLETLQEKVDQDAGSSSGAFSVLVEKSFGGNLTISTGGVFKKAEDGRDELVFSWLPRSDLKTLAYYLSGMTTLPHDKGLNYLHEGFRLTQGMYPSERLNTSMDLTRDRLDPTARQLQNFHSGSNNTKELDEGSGLARQVRHSRCCLLSRKSGCCGTSSQVTPGSCRSATVQQSRTVCTNDGLPLRSTGSE